MKHDWLTRYAYDQEMGFLHRYLKQGFDPYSYMYAIPGFLEHEGVDYDEEAAEDDVHTFGEEWIASATPQQLDDLKEFVTTLPEYGAYADRPATEHLDSPKIYKPGWLVHFTDDPWGIEHKGFVYGHEEMEGLGLTTCKMDRKKYPGFNFAFDTNSKYSTWAAREHKYGKHAVVFWASGVEAYHVGDQEQQIIFWGPAVNRTMIFPIESADGEWQVQDAYGSVRKKGEFDDVVGWVENNYRLLQQVEKRKRDVAMEKRRQEGSGAG